jgi:hypothetical protein
MAGIWHRQRLVFGRGSANEYSGVTNRLDKDRSGCVEIRPSAGVAQLVEHPICNRAVGSSSLSTSTILPTYHVLTHCN